MNQPHLRSDLRCAAALLALLALAALVWATGLGATGLVLGFAIAALKAALVAWFYMDLRTSTPLARLFALAGLYWLAILFSLTLADVLTR